MHTAKEYRDKSIKVLLQMDIEKTLSVRTVNKIMTRVSSLFNHALIHEFIEGRNPATDMNLPLGKPEDDNRAPFTQKELEWMMQSDEYVNDKAIPQIEDSSTPQDVEDDWIVNFFDKCRIVSDDEMQTLWAKVLAGEANSPGSFTKRTVNMLGSLEKKEAHLFTSLCGFGWFLGDVIPLVFDVNDSIYNDQDVNFNSLSHLDSIGLVQFSNLTSFSKTGLHKMVAVHYFGTPMYLDFRKPERSSLDVGHLLLTDTGQQLTKICRAKPVEGFLDYVIEKWAGRGLILSSPYPRLK